MTRWVRSGSTQKHKKMPGDATKWGEFDHQKKKKNSLKKLKSKSEMSFSKIDGSRSFDNRSKSNINPTGNSQKSPSIKSMNFTTTAKKLKGNSNIKSCPTEKDLRDEHVHDKNAGTSSPLNKKKKFLKKLQKRKAEKGTMLLPSKVERKLYYIKKKLSEKGVPPNTVKDIIRKERTKAELNFRKTFSPSKLCFHCKKPGHMLADCPEKLGTSAQETGFKSRSAEHTSFKCPEKVQGFPSIRCFVCKEQGHISKDCSKNKQGVFLKGRRCHLCGNVNHLKKDCPSLNKQKADESSITLHTIKEEISIDAEVMDKDEMKRKKKKKPKIVKF